MQKEKKSLKKKKRYKLKWLLTQKSKADHGSRKFDRSADQWFSNWGPRTPSGRASAMQDTRWGTNLF